MKTFQIQFSRTNTREVTVQRLDPETLLLTVGDQQHRLKIETLSDRSFILDEENGRTIYHYAVDGDLLHLAYPGGTAKVEVLDKARMLALEQAGGGASGIQSVSTSMPGQVVKVLVDVGDTVETGQPVIIVEAMKMENVFKAEAPGVVTKVGVAAGDSVEGGVELLRIEEATDGE